MTIKTTMIFDYISYLFYCLFSFFLFFSLLFSYSFFKLIFSRNIFSNKIIFQCDFLSNDYLYCEQKARMARIRIAKATTGAAFLTKKRETEARLAAAEQVKADDGEDIEYRLNTSVHHVGDDIFELQHHHLLQCLERTTVGTLRNALKQINESNHQIFMITAFK